MARAGRQRPTITDPDFWSRLTSFAAEGSVVIDRPKGTAHPRIPELIYPLDYGYLTNLRSGDGDGVDVWVGSRKRRTITGVICTVDFGKRDLEVKILLGCTPVEVRRILLLHNWGDQRAVLIRPEAVRTAAPRRKPRRHGGRR
jgi:inorganic pyrophosphatase